MQKKVFKKSNILSWKSPRVSEGNASQSNKDYIWQTHPQDFKWKKKMLEFILLKSAVIQGFPLFPLRFCVVLGLLATSIKHEKEMYWIELGKRSQMSLMCKQYGIIYNRAKNILKKTSRNNKKFQESFSIQNHLREISSLSVHQQK